MGGCQSYSSSAEDAGTHTQTATLSDISIHKLRNNNEWAAGVCERPYLQQQYLSERVAETDLLTLSALPHGIHREEWIATHTTWFFQNITLLSAALSDFCTSRSCPTANGPGNKVYFWTDEQGRKLKCSGPLYTDYTLSYIQELLTDEEVFPTRAGAEFPAGFVFLAQKVFLLLFRTLAHLYSAHFPDVVAVGMNPHLNTLFTHLITFSLAHDLLEPDETGDLSDLITALTHTHTHTPGHKPTMA